mmetsp:Transcript_6590/g.22698  ORF Transcript_6590/g.22698 Transcript_6590/m.22698 type:complete len:198 (+) Transcript_6590:186-779(+)
MLYGTPIDPSETIWKMKEKLFSFSGDDFKVEDLNGQPLFTVDGQVFSMRSSKSFKTMDGNQILEISKKMMAVRQTWHMYQGDDRRVTVVKKLLGFGSTYYVYLLPPPYPNHDASTDLDALTPTFTLTGSIFDKEYCVYLGDNGENGPKVAQVSRKMFSAMNMVFGNDTYGIKVAPGVDVCLVLASVVIVDEIENDEH